MILPAAITFHLLFNKQYLPGQQIDGYRTKAFLQHAYVHLLCIKRLFAERSNGFNFRRAAGGRKVFCCPG